jgi:ascorbate-specific PTS system EIIC-type component UlaA
MKRVLRDIGLAIVILLFLTFIGARRMTDLREWFITGERPGSAFWAALVVAFAIKVAWDVFAGILESVEDWLYERRSKKHGEQSDRHHREGWE